MRGGVFFSRTCARKLLVGSRGRHVGARRCTEAERRLAGAVGFHRAGADSNQRGAHTPRARVLRILPRERERARWRYFLRTCVRKLLVGSHGWHVGARPCTEGKRCLAGAVGFHLAGADCSQRGAARKRRKRECYASSRERARDGAWPCSEGEGRLTGAVGFHRAGSDSNQRGAHAPQARVLRLLQRERACAVAFFFAHMRKEATCWKPRQARRSAAVHRGRAPSRWRSGLP